MSRLFLLSFGACLCQGGVGGGTVTPRPASP